MKNYLILSGGGFKGSYQLGAVEVLLNKGVKFDKVFGVSAGAINGSLIAQNKIKELKEFYFELAEKKQSFIFKSIFGYFKNDKLKISFFKIFKELFKKGFKESLNEIESLFSSEIIFEKLKTLVKKEDFISDFYSGSVSLYNGEYNSFYYKDFDKDEDLIKSIISSASIPIVLNPIDRLIYNNKYYYDLVDGGVVKSSPISDAIKIYNKEDSNEDVYFYIVNCNNGEYKINEKVLNVANITAKTLEIMMGELFKNDFKLFNLINEVADGIKYKKFNYTLIQPTGAELGGYLETDKIIENYFKGQLAALNLNNK